MIKSCIATTADSGAEETRAAHSDGSSLCCKEDSKSLSNDPKPRALGVLDESSTAQTFGNPRTNSRDGDKDHAEEVYGPPSLRDTEDAVRAVGKKNPPSCAFHGMSCGPPRSELVQDEGNDGSPTTATSTTKDQAKPVHRRNLFADETVTSFFRRLAWSPDGAFLVTPTAQHWDPSTRTTKFCTYIFTRGHFAK